jgi:xylulokinase
MCHAVPGKWCVFGCMLAAGGSFQWFRNQLGQNEVHAAKRRKVDPYELLIAEAEKADPGSGGVFFLPYLTGERCPHPDPCARGGWIGITTRTLRRDLVRSLLEGVTFGMRDAVEIMNQMNIPITQIRASGGGARSAFWRQLQADIYNKPIVMTNATEGPAYGVALLAGVGTGAFKSVEDACKRSIKQTEKIAPTRKLAARYEQLFPIYDRLYDRLKDSFAEISACAS